MSDICQVDIVTLSYSGENEEDCVDALKRGANSAVVFSTKKDNVLPDTWNGFKVVDGDVRDDLMLDVSGVVLGLRAKGKAKKDTSGFVVQVN